MTAAPIECGAAAQAHRPRNPNNHTGAANGTTAAINGKAPTASGIIATTTVNGAPKVASRRWAAAAVMGSAESTKDEPSEATLLEGLPISEARYAQLGISECTSVTNRWSCSISSRIVRDHLLNRRTLKIAVEIDGVLPPPEKVPYSRTNLRMDLRGYFRIVPSPQPAVGKLCVGWGWIAGEQVLVMQVVSRLVVAAPHRKRHITSASGALSYAQSFDSTGQGVGGGLKRSAAEAGLGDRALRSMGGFVSERHSEEVKREEGMAGEVPAKEDSKAEDSQAEEEEEEESGDSLR